jgi:hypothetical protein
MIQEDKEEMKFNVSYQLLVCADRVNLLHKDININKTQMPREISK